MALNGLGIDRCKLSLEAAVGKNPTGSRTIKFYTVAPAFDGTGGTQCSYTGYAAITTAAADWGTASVNVNEVKVVTVNDLTLHGVTSGSDVTIVAAGIWNGSSLEALIPLSVTLHSGDPDAVIPAGTFGVASDPTT